MAYTSLIPVRRLDRAISYVRDKNKITKPGSLEEAVDYALNRDKTESVCFETGLSCLCETAFADMKENVQRWHKTGGVQGYHLVQSFAEGEVTPELAHQIGVELADQLLAGRYQAVVTTHLNTGHIHNHIVWCAVALDNGRKYHSNAKSYYTEVRARSDALCRQYGLSVIETERSQQSSQPYTEWQAGQTGQSTWRSLIRQDVDDAINHSLTWRQFVRAMEEKGYTMRFDRKYPILQPPDKTRPVRFKTLGKRYTPQAIRNRILYPRWRYPTGQREPVVWYGRLHGTHRKARKLTGLRALYYSYLYKVGVLRKKPPYPSYAVREDIRKLDQRIEQAEFIFQHHVEDRGQLARLRQQAEDEIAVLLKRRQKLYRYEPDSPQISALTEKLRQLRHTAKLCRNIETHSVEMEQRLLAAQEEDRQRQEREERQQERKTKDEPRR